jgi:hypothetical protein
VGIWLHQKYSVGQRVEADYFQCDFNEREMKVETGRVQTVKLPTHGGAVAAYISVDVYSGYITGRLVKSMTQPVDRVCEINWRPIIVIGSEACMRVHLSR